MKQKALLIIVTIATLVSLPICILGNFRGTTRQIRQSRQQPNSLCLVKDVETARELGELEKRLYNLIRNPDARLEEIEGLMYNIDVLRGETITFEEWKSLKGMEIDEWRKEMGIEPPFRRPNR